jgi:hypothetical protein
MDSPVRGSPTACGRWQHSQNGTTSCIPAEPRIRRGSGHRIRERNRTAPYQGKIISMSNGSGYTTDRDGNRVSYISVGQTTYGEPDGLWGINCHPSPPDPFIPGVSRQHDKPADTVKERYDATQRQRYYEREVHNAKRVAACYDASGDTEAFQKAAIAVKERTSQLKAICIQNHLPYYGDRVQVYGYGRSQASKATGAARWE